MFIGDIGGEPDMTIRRFAPSGHATELNQTLAGLRTNRVGKCKQGSPNKIESISNRISPTTASTIEDAQFYVSFTSPDGTSAGGHFVSIREIRTYNLD
jgi:hypothetical protein